MRLKKSKFCTHEAEQDLDAHSHLSSLWGKKFCSATQLSYRSLSIATDLEPGNGTEGGDNEAPALLSISSVIQTNIVLRPFFILDF